MRHRLRLDAAAAKATGEELRNTKLQLGFVPIERPHGQVLLPLGRTVYPRLSAKTNCSRTFWECLASELAQGMRMQDLQIYLSDVFELGIEELNEASLREM